MGIDDWIDQFTESVSFDALIVWANLFGVDHEESLWFDDTWPDHENELRQSVADEMRKIGKERT